MTKKILIIEDIAYLSELYDLKFRQDGYQVIIRDNGPDGIKAAAAEQPDLILLDIIMPDMDGYQVLRKLRENPKTKKLKIYILSNLGQTDEINRGYQSGADGYFIKSDLTPRQLTDKIKKILSGQKIELNNHKKADSTDKKASKSAALIKPTIKATALLISDEQAMINVYKLSFAKAGLETAIANDSAWGIKLAAEGSFDVIVIDLTMPSVNGFKTIKKLKADPKTRAIPVIVLAFGAQSQEARQAKKLGAACYLSKSAITPAKLIKEINKLLRNNKKS